MASLATRLYRGEVSYDFLRRRKVWYSLSGVIILASLVSLFARGLNLSIEFTGGDAFQFSSNGHSVATADAALTSAGIDPSNATVQLLGGKQMLVQTKYVGNAKTSELEAALSKDFGVSENNLSPETVGPSWGSQITEKAIEGLIIFLVAVVIYITLRFEARMAAAALAALAHDLLVTAGIYSIVGFGVSPATVIALLTILGFSLYDTVVVFDKVRENTSGLGPQSKVTYSQAANLALNQTLMRSINTSLIALLPVGALLFVGAGLLGAGTLKDLALAQFVGLASGAYSSIFIATPLLAQLKEREPTMRDLATRVARARSRGQGTAAVATAQEVADELVVGYEPDRGGEDVVTVPPLAREPGAPLRESAAREPGAPMRVPGAPMDRSGARGGRRGGKGRPSGKRKR
jgi:preprotein translocase subunit SecF